ncbi:putative F-box/LRR-repeat protein At3g58880 [Silene latifolia]|uniref:putative F-box/LRR-repeat protein At3g58880 n=1 Tax=Silene latifolia TaxID=37657 RepID=UPI003D77AE72
MASPDSKQIDNLDHISQLPESMILNILSRLPLEDSARASILSKTWKRFCSLYPILYFDHNLFALQSLVAAKEGGGGPDINQIRDMFMDRVDYQLSGAMLLDSPIRKLALTVALNDSVYISRVDKLMELVRQINVEDLCITVLSADFMSCRDDIIRSSVVYELPLSVLSSKGLRSACIRGCNFGCETLIEDPINKYFSLQRLCLSHVFMDEHVLENLIRHCQGIEILVLDNCSVEIEFLTLSKFPKLKRAVIRIRAGKLDYVDIVDTNLECFKCYSNGTEVLVSPVACAGIRELTVAWGSRIQPDLLKDLTAIFPFLEEGELHLHGIDTLKAANNGLRKFYCYSPLMKEVHIDCPSLTLLHCSANDLSELYVDCPKLREFGYWATAIPDRVFCSSMANLEESQCCIIMFEACDTLWLVKLRAFLILVMGNATNVKLTFKLPMARFEPEQVEAIELSPLYNVHLTLVIGGIMQDIAPLMDGLLWIIRPTTLTVSCRTPYVVKYLCENLYKKQEDSICNEQLIRPCWMHKLKDFHVDCPLGVPVTKKNLAAFPEQCRTLLGQKICFKFHWCFN